MLMTDDRKRADAPEDARGGHELLPLVYAELRRLARARMAKVPPGNTLQPTELVHEAYARLVGTGPNRWANRGHFFVAAAEAMRRILVEQARRKASVKHGGHLSRVEARDDQIVFNEPVEDVIALHESIDRLRKDDERKADVVLLRSFAGLTREEVATALGISVRTVDREWRYILARFHHELTGYGDDP